MAAVNELESFIAKFRYLCSSGYRASLSFNSDVNGNAHVAFEVDLGFIQPPFAVPPPPSTSPKKRSPGYYRRLQRRRQEREQLDSSKDLNDTLSVLRPIVDTEKDVKNCEKDVVIESACDSTGHVDDGENFAKENDADFKRTEEVISVEDGKNVTKVTTAVVKHDDVLVASESSDIEVADVGRICSTDDLGPRFTANEPAVREETCVNVAPFDENLSAIDNLRNLTLSLDLIHRSRMSNTLH